MTDMQGIIANIRKLEQEKRDTGNAIDAAYAEAKAAGINAEALRRAIALQARAEQAIGALTSPDPAPVRRRRARKANGAAPETTAPAADQQVANAEREAEAATA